MTDTKIENMAKEIIDVFYPFIVGKGLLFEYTTLIKCGMEQHIINMIKDEDALDIREFGVSDDYNINMKHICKNYLFGKKLTDYWQDIEKEWVKYYENILYIEKLGHTSIINKLKR